MPRSLSQEEIDNLVRALSESENDENIINNDFVIELLTEKLEILENKKREFLNIIEKEYEPKIDSLKKALSKLGKIV